VSTIQTRLNQTDLNAIESRIAREVAALVQPPTLESLQIEGYSDHRHLNNALDWIAGTGRVVTLLVAEIIQSAAALIIAVVFGLLEYHRVLHGAEALGQNAEQAGLIAFAVVCANIVHPIYALRDLRGQQHYTIHRPTLRGYLEAFSGKLWGKPTQEQVDWSYNPVLHVAAMVITWTTIVLAVYDLLAPLVTSILTGTTTKPWLILLIELLMGFGLSLAGVFFLQSAAHEIGVRTLTDQPKRLTDVLAERRREYDAQIAAIRERVTAEHMAGKVADETRRGGVKAGEASGEAAPFSMNGATPHANGKG